MTEACERNVEMAPAMNIAGTTHASVWWMAYH